MFVHLMCIYGNFNKFTVTVQILYVKHVNIAGKRDGERWRPLLNIGEYPRFPNSSSITPRPRR